MSKNWVKDIADMHKKYGVQSKVSELDETSLGALLKFRLDFLAEEYNELCAASLSRPVNAEETVDALIDLCVVAIGTLDLFGVDAYAAWDEVLRANMNKEVGIKPSRPNPLGLPDLIKKPDWIPPSHAGNHGTLNTIA
jgi:predicted HAD superfamily Cof-like phosphohydrolase